jgi:hypothetical protein
MFDIIKEKNGIALIEMKGKFHVIRLDRFQNKIYPIVPNDFPPTNVSMWATLYDEGIRFVSKSRTQANAIKWFQKLTSKEI